MKMLILQQEFETKRSKDLIPLECIQCGNTHYRNKGFILSILHGIYSGKNKGCYCSLKCHYAAKTTIKTYNCKQCSKSVNRLPAKITGNVFCSSSCAATWNNTHKTKGTRRSKLEAWLESELTKKYPNLEIHYNKTDAINAELDIYIPSLKLAFELNGIFHYEPIYGKEKFDKTVSNDNRKFQACLERGISLCIINTSNVKYFKEITSMKFLQIICDIIEQSKNGSQDRI